MAPPSVYLDCNATMPVLPAAVEAVTQALGVVGNPSSVHAAGRRARALVEDARDAVADLAGALPRDVIFTSGGTEALALALHGLAGEGPRLVSAVEHPCVLAAAGDGVRIPVDADGLVVVPALERLLEEVRPACVAVQAANNETGVLQPLAAIAERVRTAGVPLIVDAVQAAGKLDVTALPGDALAVSAHKIGGPQGVGALILRGGRLRAPLVGGGGQERGWRGGTQNTPGIAGFGAAARRAAELDVEGLRALRDLLEAEIVALAPGAVVFGQGVPRLPNTTCVRLPGIDQQRQLMALDLAGVAVSAGSACSSGKVEPSHVLTAMGVPESAAREAIRISLGWATTRADIDAFLAAWAPMAVRTSVP